MRAHILGRSGDAMALPIPPTGGFRSLTARLIVWTLLAVGGVYAATVTVSNAIARRTAMAAAEREAVNEAEAAVSRVEDLLHSVEERTLALGEALSVLGPREAEVDPLLRRFVQGNRDLYGAAIAWAPGPRAERRALYYHWAAEGGSRLEAADLASEGYRYWERAWFKDPLAAGGPLWTEPYRDEGGGEVSMVTFAVPFSGPGGAPAGVVTADVRLQRLDSIVKAIELGRKGFGLVLSRSGVVIAASRRRESAASGTVLQQARVENRARLEPIVKSMLSGEKGFARVELEGVPFRLTYRPLSRAGWSLAALYPEDELLDEVAWLRTVQGLLALGGLALLALVVVVLSRRITRPLAGLAASAGRIARGDLDAPLPPVESRDEVGTLARAFHDMRDSLKEYIRNLQETTAAKERLEGELKVARRIQADMLPRPVAGGRDEGFELGATLVSARTVGGDLFDHFRDGSRVFFLVGDVSGKGIAAALFMARAKTVFETVASREADPAALLATVNRSLCRDNDAGMFVTAVAGVLDLASGDLAFAVAGHEPPVLVSADGAPELASVVGGRVLGLIEASEFPVNRLRLGKGDAVVLYTDGVSEAQDAGGGFFGLERLVAATAGLRHEAAPALTNGVLAAVRAFAGGAPQSDDITILTLRYLGPRG
jgi:sigma-B regulation protein RsbU (phosphoserine phosphatase)